MNFSRSKSGQRTAKTGARKDRVLYAPLTQVLVLVAASLLLHPSALAQDPPAGPPAGTAGEHVLGPIDVEGTQHTPGANGSTDATATEGTGSYTTNSASVGSRIPQSLKETPQS